jgi:glutamine kinase
MTVSDSVFSSKSNVLKSLQPQLQYSKIEKIIDFTVEEWRINQEKILSTITSSFHNQIIIRSSAIGEDSVSSSQAGSYDSILNVDSKINTDIISAVNLVIDSYKILGNLNPQNQILVQNQTTDVILSGVIFTRNEHSGSPYYTINFEQGPSTVNVTHGKINNIIKIFCGTNLDHLSLHWKLLLNSIQEIENLFENNFLDIEFGITKYNDVIIFQVRPIVTTFNQLDIPNTQLIHNEISKNQNYFSEFNKEGNSNPIFSDMADWNPSEIIGSNPNLLDYSLYSFLIMDSVWHKGRKDLGYFQSDLPNLMIKFGNKPFVNIEASFHSLLPKTINGKLREKLVNFCIQKLRENPHLHDKVEFNILFTCYDLNTDDRLRELLSNHFSQIEINEIKQKLILHTNYIIKNFTSLNKKCTNNLLQLTTQKIPSLELLSKTDYKENLNMAKQLLDDCITYGTIPFSSMARVAFVSNAILKSIHDKNKKIDIGQLMNSIQTPLTQLCEDLNKFNDEKITKDEFLEKYGHLRPGTYDITASRYDDDNPFFNNMEFLRISLNKKENTFNFVEINKILENSPLDFSEIEFYSFLEQSISQREMIKFLFTKNLSNALELIASAANKLGFTRDDVSNLDVDTIFSPLDFEDLKVLWQKKINAEKSRKQICNYLFLPSIINSIDDFEIIQYGDAKPNFITKESINGQIVNLNLGSEIDLKNKIILIENADPGYDWIFTKKPLGLITKYGGAASHMAIRCLEIGLPAAIGCGDLLYDKLSSSKNILLDCVNERIVILEHEKLNDDDEVNKTLKSIGYIK